MDERTKIICELLKKKNIPLLSDIESIKITRQDLERVHTKEYLNKLFGDPEEVTEAVCETFELIDDKGSYHRYDPTTAILPLSTLIQKVLIQTTGTMHAVEVALKSGEDCYYLGGGQHHAMTFAGRGFCLLNDIVIAARWAQNKLQAKLIWVIDVDAHKGDGTAEITQNDSTIRTLSIHMKEGWPLDSDRYDQNGKLNPWFIESDIEISIGKGEEAHYLQNLKDGLSRLAALDSVGPDLAIVVQGSDPYEKDALPSSALLKLSKAQMLERDMLVYHFLKEKNIPQVYVMAGGYGEYSAEIYCQFIEALHD